MTQHFSQVSKKIYIGITLGVLCFSCILMPSFSHGATEKNEIEVFLKTKQIKHLKEGIKNTQFSSEKDHQKNIQEAAKQWYILDYQLEEESTQKSLESDINTLSKTKSQLWYAISNDQVSLWLRLTPNEAKELQEKEQLPLREEKKYVTTYTPNDTFYNQQWHLSKIDYKDALNIATGNSSIKLAIIDEGFELNHSDLTNQIAINSGETPDNSIDDDGNGWVDDYQGCKFFSTTGDEFSNYDCSESAIAAEGSTGHGTNTSGIANAETNNAQGIASICPDCEFIPIAADLSESSLYGAILYAIDQGATAINFSLATTCPSSVESTVITQAIEAAEAAGIVFVQSAGNNGDWSSNTCLFWCGSGNQLCYDTRRNETYYYIDGRNVSTKLNVGATTSSDNRSSFSNYDVSQQATSIAAPGSSIVTTFCIDTNYSSCSATGYGTANGTSYSAPMVTGAVGLLKSAIDPYRTLSASELSQAIKDYGEVIQTDHDISDRRLNIFTLLSQMEAIEKVKSTDYRFISRFYSPVFEGHFYTGDVNETKGLINTDPNWNYEGINFYAYKTQITDTLPVYRFHSNNFNSHFYTIDESEKNRIETSDPNWELEGPAYYAYPITYSGGGTKEVYRFWNPTSKHHFYTDSVSERDNILNNDPNWDYDGPAYRIPNDPT